MKKFLYVCGCAFLFLLAITAGIILGEGRAEYRITAQFNDKDLKVQALKAEGYECKTTVDSDAQGGGVDCRKEDGPNVIYVEHETWTTRIAMSTLGPEQMPHDLNVRASTGKAGVFVVIEDLTADEFYYSGIPASKVSTEEGWNLESWVPAKRTEF